MTEARRPDVTDLVEIGRGGFGVVYRARQERFRREVAVKVITATLDERARTRFTQECRALGQLSGHPHIVPVYDGGVDPDEQPSPWTAAVLSFLCFAVGGIVPLIPFLLGSSSLAVSLLVGAVGLFVVGAVTSRFTDKPWWFAGGRQLLFGAIAAGATFLVGSLIGVSAG